MTPKSLLRHPMAISNFEEIGPGTSLKHVIPDSIVKPGNVKKVLLCTGKVYYDLVIERQEKQLEDKIAIIRIEQLCPFPYHLLAMEIAKYPRAKVRNQFDLSFQLRKNMFAMIKNKKRLLRHFNYVYADHVAARRA